MFHSPSNSQAPTLSKNIANLVQHGYPMIGRVFQVNHGKHRRINEGQKDVMEGRGNVREIRKY